VRFFEFKFYIRFLRCGDMKDLHMKKASSNRRMALLDKVYAVGPPFSSISEGTFENFLKLVRNF
jgi:hypothetical protein